MEKNLSSFEQNFTSWTDDIPTCQYSGVGSICNEVYRQQDGRRAPIHPGEDRTFRFSKDEYGLSLYGVFDGFSGDLVADFVMKRLPAELLLGQLVPDIPPDLVKDIIKQAFVSVDREFFSSIGDKLAARMVMRSDELFPEREAQLAELEKLVSSGCTATIALILNNNLYVSNVGDVQAFLCYRNNNRITSLTIQHTTSNEDENLRLQHLGFRHPQVVNKHPPLQPLGQDCYTRCLGNYPVKGGYKEVVGLETCRDEPVIAEPEVIGPIPLEAEAPDLFVITTRSVIEVVRQLSMTGKDPQIELVELVSSQLAAEPESSLSTVSQSVLDQLVRRLVEIRSPDGLVRREDMTLLLRMFGRHHQGQKDLYPYPVKQGDKTLTGTSAKPRQATRSSTTTESSGIYISHSRDIPIDEDGRIAPYVDFSSFYKLWPGDKHAVKDN